MLLNRPFPWASATSTDCRAFGYQADDHWAKLPRLGLDGSCRRGHGRATESTYSTVASIRSWSSTEMARS
jgi:hypothetical protein